MAPDDTRTPSKPETEDLAPCDLVMKGGITSGVVYPAAVLELKENYRFRSVGGTSAGAIAAAAVAAAEYGRQVGLLEGGHPDKLGFNGLESLQQQMVKEGFLLGLFQPSRKLRPLFDFAVGLIGRKLSFPAKLMAVVQVALTRFWAAALLGGAVALGLLWLVVEAFSGNWEWNVGQIVVGAMVLGVGAVPAAFVRLGIRLRTVFTKHLKDNFYGVCSGASEENTTDRAALTDWLYLEIQQCAGRGEKPPLTFADLQKHEIDLSMMTTNLSRTRPTRLPEDLAGYSIDERELEYWFNGQELRRLFPEAVCEYLTKDSVSPEHFDLDGSTYFRLPEDINRLPVIVATRMSLSFPILLSGIPLYTVSEDRRQVYQHWFSDGGIGSNFPIHFFDSWLPSRPTFGLNLTPAPISNGAASADPSRVEIGNLAVFLKQCIETMQNWRDTMQAELPGFSDRIRDIKLEKSEGGLNLNMTPETIDKLIDKGKEKGRELRDGFNLDDHKFTRYLTFMQMMAIGLRGLQEKGGTVEKFEAYRAKLDEGPPEGSKYRRGHDKAWCQAAAEQTAAFLVATEGWGPRPKVPFTDNNEPTPTPVMRITPRV